MRHSKYFERDVNALDPIFTFLKRFGREHALSRDVTFALNLAVEEIFTNLVKYHANNPQRIKIALEKRGNTISATISDFDVEPFDITKVPPLPDSLPLEERSVGGLGLHLVKKVIDQLKYEYDQKKRKSTITLIKFVGEKHVHGSRRQSRADRS